MEKLWPYVVPLPTKSRQQYQVLLSLFRSKVPMDIMRYVPLEKEAYQRTMIRRLPYSNKTIIKWLRTLVSVGTLTEGMEKARGTSTWVKSYSLTAFGKWIKLLLIPPEQIPPEQIESLVRDLFGMYMRSAIELCRRYEIDPRLLRVTMNKLYRAQRLTESPTRVSPRRPSRTHA